jgi:hypothetical protein
MLRESEMMRTEGAWWSARDLNLGRRSTPF